VVISGHAAQAAPAGLAALITQSAVLTGAAAAPLALTSKFILPAIMTKTQTATVGLLAAALAIPMAFQQLQLSGLRSELEAAPAQAAAPAAATKAESPLTSESEADELARLRKTADDLRAALAAKRSAAPRGNSQNRPADPVLLVPGRPVKLAEMTFAGNATPEAAAQSVFVARRNADFDALARYILLPPDQVEEWNQLAAAPETREEMIRHLAADLKKASTIELLQSQAIDEKRTILTFRISGESETRTNRVTYGFTGSGWKEAIY
jgi:hypothetical protein